MFIASTRLSANVIVTVVGRIQLLLHFMLHLLQRAVPACRRLHGAIVNRVPLSFPVISHLRLASRCPKPLLLGIAKRRIHVQLTSWWILDEVK